MADAVCRTRDGRERATVLCRSVARESPHAEESVSPVPSCLACFPQAGRRVARVTAVMNFRLSSVRDRLALLACVRQVLRACDGPTRLPLECRPTPPWWRVIRCSWCAGSVLAAPAPTLPLLRPAPPALVGAPTPVSTKHRTPRPSPRGSPHCPRDRRTGRHASRTHGATSHLRIVATHTLDRPHRLDAFHRSVALGGERATWLQECGVEVA